MNIDFHCPHCRKVLSIDSWQRHRNARAHWRVNFRREQAQAIFYLRYPARTVHWFQIADGLSDSCAVYRTPPTDCWFVLFQLKGDHPCILQSSRLVTISKRTGKIVYDGDARDEG